MLEKYNLILASASERRKEILSNAGYDFKIIPSNYDEKINGLIYDDELIKSCALKKAKSVLEDSFDNVLNDEIIIAADTVVVCDEIILGKPKNVFDAFNTLKNLSNKTHFVVTSICLINKNDTLVSLDKTYVAFRKLNDDEIVNYILTKHPFDKAGSYAIQDEGFDFAISLEGESDNVIGFPLKLFEGMLKKIKAKQA